MWFGDGSGIEVVFRTGVNLASTEDDPKIDPRVTEFARGMDQALLKIGERAYLAYGWSPTSPTSPTKPTSPTSPTSRKSDARSQLEWQP